MKVAVDMACDVSLKQLDEEVTFYGLQAQKEVFDWVSSLCFCPPPQPVKHSKCLKKSFPIAHFTGMKNGYAPFFVVLLRASQLV